MSVPTPNGSKVLFHEEEWIRHEQARLEWSKKRVGKSAPSAHGETKANMLYSPQMMRSCRVTVQDMEGVGHTVEVTAESLYEAVAQGLAALRGREWVAGITHGTVKVSVADVRVEHEVKMAEFTKWLERPAGSPREMIQRQKIRSILGMPVQTS